MRPGLPWRPHGGTMISDITLLPAAYSAPHPPLSRLQQWLQPFSAAVAVAAAAADRYSTHCALRHGSSGGGGGAAAAGRWGGGGGGGDSLGSAALAMYNTHAHKPTYARTRMQRCNPALLSLSSNLSLSNSQRQLDNSLAINRRHRHQGGSVVARPGLACTCM